MAILTKFMSINLTETIFVNFYREHCLAPFPKFQPMTSFFPQNYVIDQNLGYFQKISSRKYIKIISVRFMDKYLVKKAINGGGKFSQNRSFLVKMFKIGSFWGQNDVIGRNLGKSFETFYL